MKRLFLLEMALGILVFGIVFATSGEAKQETYLKFEKFDGGFFSIEKPKGWEVFTAGACADFAFLVYDPHQPLRQIFYFGEVGPVYISEQQKEIDYQYMKMGGYPIIWYEMPVVNPLTPSNFLRQFHLIAKTEIAQRFMPQCPRLENLHIVSVIPQRSPIGVGETELARALFVKENELGEGLFLLTVVPLLPFTGQPSAGIAYGFLVVGISAPKGEFPSMESTLVKSVKSFNVSRSYVSKCLEDMTSVYEGILKAGKTLSETSDVIMQGWESRNRVDDILSGKWSDAILGKERLYDPHTGEVYEFENGFYDNYDLNREGYEMNNLQLLSDDDYELWMQAPLDGYKNLR